MPKSQLPEVVVIGGSIAGLSTGIALRCLGCDVHIYEQSPTTLRGRGGGLVVQFEMLDWMTTHGIAALATLSIPGVERQFLDRQGRVIQRFPDSTPFTSWDAVFRQLRAAFPDEAYHHTHECVGLSTEAARPVAEFASGERAEADMVIGADGVSSVVRRHLFPEAQPVYAGYVAWRGVFPESLAPAHVVETLARRFTLFQGPDFHLLSYLIPGERGNPGADGTFPTESGGPHFLLFHPYLAASKPLSPRILSDRRSARSLRVCWPHTWCHGRAEGRNSS